MGCSSSLWQYALCLLLLHHAAAQTDFSIPQIPNPFNVGDMYPPRPETDVCRPIEDYIHRNSARFSSQLVTNSNPGIIFSTSDNRIMSSRLHSRLNSLATAYSQQYGSTMTVLKAWTPYPDQGINSKSLHYEGRTVQVRLPSSSHYNNFLRLAVEAGFDWVFYESSNSVRLSVIPTSCNRNIDCVFILDQSGSVGQSNHDLAIQFIKNVVNFFSIGPNSTQIGFVHYAGSSVIKFDLDDHQTLQDVQNAIDRIQYTGGGTRTGRALNQAATILDPSNNRGARPNSLGIPKIAVLMTDGQSFDSVTTPGNNLKNAGVQVYAIGIANARLNELLVISSDPDDDHVFLLNSYNDALGFVDAMSVTTCQSQAIITPCAHTTSTVPENSLTYFQSSCSSFDSSVVVELTQTAGSASLYCSSTATNPGPLTADTISDTSTATTKHCTVDIGSSKTVYVGVQGKGSGENQISLVVFEDVFDVTSVNLDVLRGSIFFNDVSQHQRTPSQVLTYEIAEGDTNVFQISPSGQLQVWNSNALVGSHYTLLISAQQTATCTCAQLTVHINVLSDQVTFVPSHLNNVTVPENAAVGTFVSRIMTDGAAGQVQYAITGSHGDFAISSLTGDITVASQLDYETVLRYDLDIEATSVSNPGITAGTVHLVVIILDINESPYFETPCAQTACTFSILEGLPAGTLVGSIRANDPDLGIQPNGMLSYDVTPPSAPFNISNNGDIQTREVFDFEATLSHDIEVRVSDQCMSGCSITISTRVTVHVEDANDNAPVISGQTRLELPENVGVGYVLAQYDATDMDSGSNALTAFSIKPSGGPFQIDNNGILSVTGQIDFETRQQYNVTIEAYNPGMTNLSDSIDVEIQVLNLNDESPMFTAVLYTASVDENSGTGHSIVTVQAIDNDLGNNGIVRYSILSGNFENSFTIDSTSGKISVLRDIDREHISSFNLEVEARDMGTPQSRRDTTTVTITILDINDNKPIFNPSTYSLSLREDLSTPTVVFEVYASDADEPGTPNSNFVYSIQTDAFDIHPTTGVVTLVGNLDFETSSKHEFMITAADQGSPTRSSTAAVSITVININENPPSVSGNQTIYISENTPINSTITDFDAEDSDQTAVTFSLDMGNAGNTFSINVNGTITLMNEIDFEDRMVYTVEVIASDGERSVSAWLTVNVVDENEFSPVFTGITSFVVPEEQASGTEVGRLQAIDMDGSENNSRVTYAFAQNSQISQFFDLNPETGIITTIGVLDREQLGQFFTPLASTTVIARDQADPPKQSLATITITLEDINDNTPQFDRPSYETSLLENLDAGQPVFSLSATDMDIGSNAEIRYAFTLNSPQGYSHFFSIDHVTGEIQTTMLLDCEQSEMYHFTLTAMDSGTNRRQSETTGVLHVIDENDNSPSFLESPYEVPVQENVEPDSVLVTVHATDSDKGANGVVTYSVINTNRLSSGSENVQDELPFFEVNSTSGEIVIKTGFNFQREQTVTITVIASDRGVPRLSTNTTVVFLIENVDEQAPEFPSECLIDVPEDAEVNSVIGECVAVERDSLPPNDRIAYSFHGTVDGPFRINRSTGEIILTGDLDYEDGSRSYELVVQAQDQKSLTSFQVVTITVTDVNDNSPQFSQSSYTVDLTQDRIETREILTIVATDRDSGVNSDVTFHLRPFQEELVTLLQVTAIDQGVPARNTSVNVTVSFSEVCLLQEYSIGKRSGIVYADLLCGVSISPSLLNVTFDRSNTFQCSFRYNGNLTFQWIHNGSLISQPTASTNGQNEVTYTIREADFDDSGDYACKVTTLAGSLQSIAGRARVQVPPVITVPPKDQAARIGGQVIFQCSATGIPQPRIEWFFEETEKVHEGSRLVVSDIKPNKVGRYTCKASNSPDTTAAVASVRLVLYEDKHVFEVKLEHITNPSGDGTCHYINYDLLTGVLWRLTRTIPLVVGTEGSNICNQTPCSPNPCRNAGSCVLNDRERGGYQCNCASGYTGRNCTKDREECVLSPCENGGNCTEMIGSYHCQCASGYKGRQCQYQDTCSRNNTCTEGSYCLDTQSSRQCVNETDALSVTGLMKDKVELLDDYIQTYIEELLSSSSSTGFSRKRQVVSPIVTACEARFVPQDTDKNTYILVWVCPPDEQSRPSDEQVATLCDPLLKSGYIETCKPPHGEVMSLRQVTSLADTSATVELILVKQSQKIPLDADLIVKELDRIGASDKLGEDTPEFQVSEIATLTSNNERESSESSQSGSAAAGIVLGIIICLAVAISVIVIVLVLAYKKKRGKFEVTQKGQALTECPSGVEMHTPVHGESATNNEKSDLSDNLQGTSTYDRLQCQAKVYIEGESDSASDGDNNEA